MEIDITFRDGPVDAKISATEEESYIEVLEELAEFVDEYDLTGYQMQETSNRLGPREQAGNSNGDAAVENGAGSTESHPGGSLLDGVDATKSELLRVLKTGSVEGDEIEEFPEILGNTDLLGESIQDRLLHGSIILLTILQDIHGVSEVRTTNLVDGLGASGLDKDNWKNIGQADNVAVYLNRKGSGTGATTEIRGPGKEDAYRHIEALVEDIREPEDSEGEQMTF
ncbi:hypothetical protein Hbl1158_03325 [Halobaculum sp. CBA1158]|uniref:hypothetical protein n=1 Tax=Halobaculum sp. CBA1158 TaxID=2904243 RepID=UPI001F39B543|nr:hypothetical protein [Halobaculum sp. CBA1158]UIP00409.1 hypothetical protein Hbl1158_03325 [Halobaculum sp. CBA1158]